MAQTGITEAGKAVFGSVTETGDYTGRAVTARGVYVHTYPVSTAQLLAIATTYSVGVLKSIARLRTIPITTTYTVGVLAQAAEAQNVTITTTFSVAITAVVTTAQTSPTTGNPKRRRVGVARAPRRYTVEVAVTVGWVVRISGEWIENPLLLIEDDELLLLLV